MNVNDLTEQMLKRANEWDKLYDKEGVPISVGTSIRDWLRVVESITKKLVNPRNDESRVLQDHVENLRQQLNEHKQRNG
jgi:hypothetical protein